MGLGSELSCEPVLCSAFFGIGFSRMQNAAKCCFMDIRVCISGRHWIWGERGEIIGGKQNVLIRTEKLLVIGEVEKCFGAVQVPTVGKKLSHYWRRGDDCFYSMYGALKI